ncbi:MAG: epoxide hydrolase 1, partial [Rhodococcus sp.]|nr:epoxide hydrolase 1 [Rhodococcus sp. (in: high G+C Gram-positive bacteria)]
MTNFSADAATIHPFTINVADADLDDLRRRLREARWPDELPEVGWEFGVASDHLRGLVDYWSGGFDWRAQEDRLNGVAQFTTEIDGQNIHFVHVRSQRPAAIPLLLLHGWPSTFADLVGLVGALTEPDGGGQAFDVVIPSLPGFGFSGPTRERGWGISRMAAAFAELMQRLGYDRYVVQGGDA